MDKERKEYSYELQGVMDYMLDSLSTEFPTSVFTPEYLVLSILETNKCHANMILDNCLMSDNMDELKNIYQTELSETSRRNQITNNINKSDIEFNAVLNKILEGADVEADRTGSKQIGTEHVLLSILNPKNAIPIRDVFGSMGVDYNSIYSKCRAKTDDKPKALRRPFRGAAGSVPPSVKLGPVPMKSEVNVETSISSSNDESIKKYTVNISKMVKEGKSDRIIGREREVKSIISVLARRKKNNAILVGEGGVGKTSIVYKLAEMMNKEEAGEFLYGKQIVSLDIMTMISGTHFRGMLEERMKQVMDELKASSKYILFLDDVHTMLKGNNKEKDTDISGMIGDLLTGGEVQVIAATTYKEYRNTVEFNPSIKHKFQRINVDPNTFDECVDILEANKERYGEYHGVIYEDGVPRKCVELAGRYITERSLPDSAFDVMDIAGANMGIMSLCDEELSRLKEELDTISGDKERYMNSGDFENLDEIVKKEKEISSRIDERKKELRSDSRKIVTVDDIAAAVADMTGIPIQKLSTDEKVKVAHMDEQLKKYVIGQDEAIDEICRIIKRNKVGLGEKRHTLANLLFLGGSGVGKTILSKKIAEEVFGDEKALIRLDMSEYSEKNSVAKLHGSAPGYIGYDDGGVLTNAIKNKPYSVVLLDEIEKADESIHNLFLQVFDEGRISEANGNLINCSNCIFIMTSNVGAKQAAAFKGGIGFMSDEDKNAKTIYEKELKGKFNPEFINRIDKIVTFNNLTEDNLRQIVKLELNKLGKRIESIGHTFFYTDEVVEHILKEALKQKEYGARPIIRLVQELIEDRVTDIILLNDFKGGQSFLAKEDNGEVKVDFEH